jgi:integrase
MGTVYRRGKKLWVGWLGADGKWHYKSSGYLVGQELLAKELLALIEDRVKRGAANGLEGCSVREFAGRWNEKRLKKGKATNAKLDARAIESHVLPAELDAGGRRLVFGDMDLAEVRLVHVRALLEHLELKNIGTDEQPDHLAPRTRRSIYSLVNRVFKDAEREELIAKSPCQLERGEWPQPVDKDISWREGAVFGLAELERLVSDPVVPLDRRVFYAIAFLGGCREGEIAALRWRAYDGTRLPLGSLHVHASYTRKNKREKSPKNKLPRAVPVHPLTAALLGEWRLSGWARLFGRQPTETDLLVPNRAGTYVTDLNLGDNFPRDLEALGLRRRRFHDTKRTFVTLARASGAGGFLRWVSHGPTKGEMQDTYSTPPWETLCREVLCIKAQLRGAAVLLPLASAVGAGSGGSRTGSNQASGPATTILPTGGGSAMESVESDVIYDLPRARFELARKRPSGLSPHDESGTSESASGTEGRGETAECCKSTTPLRLADFERARAAREQAEAGHQ